MTVSIDVTVSGLVEAEARIARLSPLDQGALLEHLARLIQMQTRRRIEEEKRDPDGKAWPPNRQGTPTLVRTGALSRGIDYRVSGDAAVVGVGAIGGRPYPAVMQYGATIRPKKARALVFRIGNQLVRAMRVTIPARRFLGLSAGNRDKIVEATADFLRRKLG